MVDVRALTGADLAAVLPDLARLRIAVFRDWPYLYDGNFDYEHRYLQSYRDSRGAILIGAYDRAQLVGAATGTPLEDHADDFAAAFGDTDLTDIFYCAESVLLPSYRGQGIGHRFFDFRENHARALGRRKSVFCAVVRPEDHPQRPAAYRSLDGFWRGRGYAPLGDITAHYRWTDLGDAQDTAKDMQFWGRTL